MAYYGERAVKTTGKKTCFWVLLGILHVSGDNFGSYDVIEVRVHSQSSVRVLLWFLSDDEYGDFGNIPVIVVRF